MNYLITKEGKTIELVGVMHSIYCQRNGTTLKRFLKDGVRIKCYKGVIAIESRGNLNQDQYYAVKRILRKDNFYTLRIYTKGLTMERDSMTRPIRSFAYAV